MPPRRIHLIAPAGALKPFLEKLDFHSVNQIVELAQRALGSKYDVTADQRILDADEDERRGGRSDDVARASDIESALADDRTAAIVALRGGAWLTRILPRIDFDGALNGRTHPIAVIGFSELTTLVNIAGAHQKGLGVYDLSPAFLYYGIRHRLSVSTRNGNAISEDDIEQRVLERMQPETVTFFQHVGAMIEGRKTVEPIPCRLASGVLEGNHECCFVGGNLTVLSTLVGSRYHSCINPDGRWIVLEDFNDKLERFDRLLAHFTLAGFWERCSGLLLGDFHRADLDLGGSVLELLRYHLPDNSCLPILLTNRIGHVWPMTFLPLHRQLQLRQLDGLHFQIDWPAGLTQVV